jgi:hypothetical protein
MSNVFLKESELSAFTLAMLAIQNEEKVKAEKAEQARLASQDAFKFPSVSTGYVSTPFYSNANTYVNNNATTFTTTATSGNATTFTTTATSGTAWTVAWPGTVTSTTTAPSAVSSGTFEIKSNNGLFDYTLKKSNVKRYNGKAYQEGSEELFWSRTSATINEFEFEVFIKDSLGDDLEPLPCTCVCPVRADAWYGSLQYHRKSFVLVPTFCVNDDPLVTDYPAKFGTFESAPSDGAEIKTFGFTYAFIVNVPGGIFEVVKMTSLKELRKAISFLK